jgi:hypothetical protein
MYKTFTIRYGTDTVEKIVELRKAFPDCQFARGIHKDKKGIFAFRSNDVKEYGERFELDNGDLFFSPTEANIKKLISDLPAYKSDWTDRIQVKLLNGVILEIFPASAMPRKIYLTRKVVQKSDVPFDNSTAYGALAYQMYDRTQNSKEEVKLDDPQMMDLIKMALTESYKLPMPLWDCLNLLNMSDIDKIFAASMGMSWESLLEEVKKSNAASEQTTGTSAA